MQFVNKAARQDYLLKEEIGESDSLPKGEFQELMGFSQNGDATPVVLGPEHWTDPGSGIPTTGTNLAAYFPESTGELPPMRFLTASAVGVNLLQATTQATARTALGASASTHTHIGSQVTLTGYSTGSSGPISATDSLNAAIAKLEARIVALENAS